MIEAAVDRLKQEELDLIITKESFKPLGDAFPRAGFLIGPSSSLIASAPMLAERLRPLPRVRMNRGDGPENV